MDITVSFPQGTQTSSALRTQFWAEYESPGPNEIQGRQSPPSPRGRARRQRYQVLVQSTVAWLTNSLVRDCTLQSLIQTRWSRRR